MPSGTIPPMVMPIDPTVTIPLALVTVSSKRLNEIELYDIAYLNVRDMLSGITGTIAPAVFGGRVRRVHVYVNPNKMVARGLSPLDVVNGLRKWNTHVPAGNTKLGATDHMVVTNGVVPTVAQISNFPVKIVDGSLGFVKDIGHAEDTHQIQTNEVHINGQREVYIPIYRQSGANTIKLVEGAKKALAGIQARIPKAVNLQVIFDQSVYVRHSLGSLEKEILLGAMLAALMVLLFLGSSRFTGAIFLSVPLSILAAFIGL
jgi:multidrug efflux pump subunit AcrB